MQKPSADRWIFAAGLAYAASALQGCPQDAATDDPQGAVSQAGSGSVRPPEDPSPVRVTTLSGMYESFFAPNSGANGIGMATRYRFAGNNFDSCITQVRGVAGLNRIKESGTYQIDGNVLRLSLNSGGSKELSLSYDPSRPSAMRIGGASFTRASNTTPLCD